MSIGTGWVLDIALAGLERQQEAPTTGRVCSTLTSSSTFPGAQGEQSWLQQLTFPLTGRCPELSVLHIFPEAASRHDGQLSPHCEIRPSNKVVRGLFTVPISDSQCLALGTQVSEKTLELMLRETHWTPTKSVCVHFCHEALTLKIGYNQPCRLEFKIALTNFKLTGV